MIPLLALFIPFITGEIFKVTGQGFHRKLEIQLASSIENGLLTWEITPDFYVDVYELKRLGFEFRVDDGQTPFIEIEEPAHRSHFHTLSLNIRDSKMSIPFHLRYQAAVESEENFPYAQILIPGPEIQFIDSTNTLTKSLSDPFEFDIPVGNKSRIQYVDVSTLAVVGLGTVYLIKTLIEA